VVGIDFSEEALKIAREKVESLGIENITFLNRDISHKFDFEDEYFDVVYANLSLHYFTDKTLNKIFQEIRRVLKQGGIFVACCKSTEDPLYGKGEMID
jgi:ubiquinone/menaquinone biosynthesis C-methylase UbiE